MQTRIILAYNMPEAAFDQLINAYPLGNYKGMGRNPKWFTFETDFFDGDNNVVGTLELVWYKEW